MLAKQISGAAAAASPVFVEDTFSSYLYTGNGSTQTITNGIDLAGKGGLVWVKARNIGLDHTLVDTVRGGTKYLISNSTALSQTNSNIIPSFNSNGFATGSSGVVNGSGNTYASWTFRKQAKFFDVVTYTGNGANRTIAHNLGSVPGCIIVKRTDGSADWQVYHRSSGNTKYLVLNSTAAEATSSTRWNDTTPTSTVFSVGTESTVNANGGTYVAYLFAHDAGGFGLTGTDNVISCGSAATDSSGNWTATLNWEPQFVLWKASSAVGIWEIADVMRGASMTNTQRLFPHLSNAETGSGGPYVYPTSTGFVGVNGPGPVSGTIIYIAIRRGPMRVPTDGTKVYNAITYTGDGTANRTVSTTIQPDLLIQMNPSGNDHDTIDRLRGVTRTLYTNLTYADDYNTNVNKMLSSMTNTGFVTGSDGSNYWNASGQSKGAWAFQRAPGFFDVVAYTGDGSSTRTVNHNLTVAPQLLIGKMRSSDSSWFVYLPSGNIRMLLNSTSASPTYGGAFAGTTPTATTFSFDVDINSSGQTYVTYLFATCPGVSKVGSYTGTGTTKQIDCGFTSGARFVLIKRTDSTGDWYVWDSARGIVAGNDPYLLLNSTAAEVTSTDYIDTYSAGFEISSTAPAAINANGGTFIFLAIA